MSRIFMSIVAASISLCVLVSAGLAHEKGYEVTIPQAIVPPKIDGKLDDAIWLSFKPVEWGNINTGGEVKKNQFSNSWAAYDDKFIYVAFENMEPNTGALAIVAKQHDNNVWQDDENEIFIEPVNAGAQPYFHIMINAGNVTQDDETGGAAAAWEPKLESATQVSKDRWFLEVKIPFKDLGFDKAPLGEIWGWNFNRHIMTGVDIWTGWSTTGDSFHTPNRFGDLTFGMKRLSVQRSDKLANTWGGIKSVN